MTWHSRVPSYIFIYNYIITSVCNVAFFINFSVHLILVEAQNILSLFSQNRQGLQVLKKTNLLQPIRLAG